MCVCVQDCAVIGGTRDQVGVTTYMIDSKNRGVSKTAAYTAYLNGLSVEGGKVELTEYLQRGAALKQLQTDWLSKWRV